MPDVNESTAKISMDITELKAGITEANRLIRLANSEFKAATSGMDAWEDSADGLSKTIQALTKVQDAQQKKLDLLKDQYKLVAAEQGESSEAAQNLQIKINNQQTAVNKTTAQLKKYQQELDGINSASDSAAAGADKQQSAYEKLQSTISQQQADLNRLKTEYASVALEQGKNSAAAKDLANDITKLSTEINDNQQKMKNAESAADSFDKSLDDVGNSANDAKGGFTVLKGAIAEFAGNMLTSAVSGIKDFVGSLFELSEATEEYRSMMAKTAGSAESFGYSVDFANDKYSQFYQYLGDDQMSTNAITNLMGMKVSTDTVSDAANAAISVWSAYGDSIPIESLTESINESAQVAQVTGTLADTINWAARSNEDWSAAMAGHSAAQAAFNKAIADGEAQEDAYSAALAACADTQERADLIAQTLNQTYGKSKATYDEMNGSILDANAAELQLKDTQAQLGAAIEPVNTAITNLKNNALQAILPAVQNVTSGFTNMVSGLLDGSLSISDVANNLLSGFADAAGKAPEMMVAGQNIMKNIISGISESLPDIVSKGVEALQNFLTGLKEQAPTLISNGFDMVINLVEGIFNALPDLIAAIPQIITTILTTLTSNLPLILAKGVELLWTLIKGIISCIPNLIAAVPQILLGFLQAIGAFFTEGLPTAFQGLTEFFSNLPTMIGTFLQNAITWVQNFVTNLITKAGEIGTNFVNAVINFFSTLPERIGYFIGYVLGSIATWVSNMIAKAQEVGSNFISAVVTFFSTLPERIGQFIGTALGNIVTWVANMIAKAKEAGSNFVTNVINFIKNLPSNLATWLTNAAGKVVEWGSQLMSKGKAAANKLVTSVVDTIKSIPGKLVSIGKDIVNGIWKGISGAAGWLKDKVSGFVDGIVGGFKDALKIGSPSKVFAAEAKWIPGGVGQGIEENEDMAINPVEKLTKKMRSAARSMSSALIPEDTRAALSGAVGSMRSRLTSAVAGAARTNEQIRDIVFNQYNTSPKSLSRLDIYRQTRSQLFFAKGKLSYV